MKYFISIIIFFSLFSFAEAYSQGCNGSASFSYVNNGNAEVSFTNTSSVAGSITAVAWNFGDGSTSNQSNPTHTYGANGYYTVTLNVTSVQDFGYYGTLTCNDATSNTIMINNSNSAYGCMDISACNYDPNATVDDGSCIVSSTWVTLQMNDAFGDGWGGHTWSAISTTGGNSYGPYTLNSGNSGWEAFCIADDCYDVICEVVGWNYGDASWSLTDDNGTVFASGGAPYNSTLITGTGCSILGCMDEGACNYDSVATVDDGSCIYANPPYDCEGDCLNDLDEDNICDEIDDCVGEWVEDIETGYCGSLNTYSSCYAFSDCSWSCMGGWYLGECVGYYGCGGGYYEENNSYCDALIVGCTDAEACNYDSEAEVESGECIYTEVGYDCDGGLLCPFDIDLDGYSGVPDLLIILSSFGCVSDCTGDVTGDGAVAIDDLLSLLSSFGSTCE